MEPIVYGLCVDPEEAGSLAAVMAQHPDRWFVAALADTDEDRVSALLKAPGIMGRLTSARDLCGPLVRSVVPLWPSTEAEAHQYMSKAPGTLAGWTLRTLLYQFATGGFVYSVSEATTKTQDIVTHLTVARMFGQTSIGILPGDMRTMIESTTLTLTDHIVVEADRRGLSLVLESLNKDPDTP